MEFVLGAAVVIGLLLWAIVISALFVSGADKVLDWGGAFIEAMSSITNDMRLQVALKILVLGFVVLIGAVGFLTLSLLVSSLPGFLARLAAKTPAAVATSLSALVHGVYRLKRHREGREHTVPHNQLIARRQELERRLDRIAVSAGSQRPGPLRLSQGWLESIAERYRHRLAKKTNVALYENLLEVNKCQRELLTYFELADELACVEERAVTTSLERERTRRELQVKLKELARDELKIERETQRLKTAGQERESVEERYSRQFQEFARSRAAIRLAAEDAIKLAPEEEDAIRKAADMALERIQEGHR